MHIPKTGGTALREALFRAAPEALRLCDYGADSPATSPLVRELCYGEDGDVRRLRAAVADRPQVVLWGHFKSGRYAALRPEFRVATVLRDPAERVVSNYLHLLTRGRVEGSLLAYARQPEQRDVQARFVGPKGLRRFAHVGVQAQLQATAEVLSDWLGRPIRLERLNVGSAGPSCEIGPTLRRELLLLNPRDEALYREALDRAGSADRAVA